MYVIDRSSGLPLIGLIFLGVLDRGSNLLQVRTHTACNLRCTFCSTSANNSHLHPTSFLAEKEYLVSWVSRVIALKEDCSHIELNLDSVGEPTAYPDLVALVSELRALPRVTKISMQTNGTLLTQEKILALKAAGLDRINLSLHSLDPVQAKELMGQPTYDLSRVLAVIDWILASGITLCLTPVYLPDVNDAALVALIHFAQQKNCLVGIQKYEIYKFSRKMKGAHAMNWYKFYRQLTLWEREFAVKLKIGPAEMGIVHSRKIPLLMRTGDLVSVRVLYPGWFAGQVIGESQGRAVTLLHSTAAVGSVVRAKIVDASNSIYLAQAT